jgi:hypothetical protein
MSTHTFESLAHLITRIDPHKLNIGSSTSFGADNVLDTVTVEYDWANCQNKSENSFTIKVYGKSEHEIEDEIRRQIKVLNNLV